VNTQRILQALGGSAPQRLAPHLEGIEPRSVGGWKARGAIPLRHQAGVIRALEEHAEEVVAALEEAREAAQRGKG
jgi:hypothetical protein